MTMLTTNQRATLIKEKRELDRIIFGPKPTRAAVTRALDIKRALDADDDASRINAGFHITNDEGMRV